VDVAIERATAASILPRMPENSEVAPKAVSEALASGDAMLIDVREKSEYDDLRIPGSVLIPLGELSARLAEVPADRDVYVHCRMGGRSARAVDYLRTFGRPNSYNVTGGIEAWEEAGLPVER
jgi:sulfur-carrier protein adenylyltransferase/sulfurtransferase